MFGVSITLKSALLMAAFLACVVIAVAWRAGLIHFYWSWR